MASLPAQQPQRRSSQGSGSQSSAPSQPSRRASTYSRTEETQTIFGQSNEEQSQAEQAQRQEHEDQDFGAYAPPRDIDDDPSIKKCWICFSDSTEDTSETSPWRDPCPCALEAHEECLLDWIADMEAPNNPRQAGRTETKIQCPQCKGEIKLARPRSWVVDGVTALQRTAARQALPMALCALGGLVYRGSLSWGVHSIYAVFGTVDGFEILRPWIRNTTRPPLEVYLGEGLSAPTQAAQALQHIIFDHLENWRLYVGLPLISPVLILSRTKYADHFLPMLPIIFFAKQAYSPSSVELARWPPSPSFAFAILPYVRSLYNIYYDKVWAKKEQQWLAAVQPRANEQPAAAEADPGAPEPIVDDENVFEVRIDGGIWQNWGDGNEAGQQENNNVPAAGQGDEDPGAPGPDAQQNRLQPQNANAEPAPAPAGPAPAPEREQPAARQDAPRDRRMVISYISVAESIVGALMFPTIAGLSGDLLKLLLPRAWTAAPQASSRFGYRFVQRGLLQERWARSIIGGCLFVVCKDALMLYVRWKMAQMHIKRRVLDYDRTKGKKAGRT